MWAFKDILYRVYSVEPSYKIYMDNRVTSGVMIIKENQILSSRVGWWDTNSTDRKTYGRALYRYICPSVDLSSLEGMRQYYLSLWTVNDNALWRGDRKQLELMSICLMKIILSDWKRIKIYPLNGTGIILLFILKERENIKKTILTLDFVRGIVLCII